METSEFKSGLLLRFVMLLASLMKTSAALGRSPNKIMHGTHEHLTTNATVNHMVYHPAFKGFSKLLLPKVNDADYRDTTLNNIGSLLPYHNHVASDVVVAALNYMIDEVNEGKTIFYDFYTEQERRADPAKASTGLFFSGENREPRLPLCARAAGFPMSAPCMKDSHMRLS